MSTNSKESIQFNAFKKGDEFAFEYFFNLHLNALTNFCVQFIYSKEEAHGIAQEAFLNLWLNKDKIETLAGIKSFLYTFAKSKCLNLIRNRKVRERYKNETLNQKERELDFEILSSLNFDPVALSELDELITKSIEELPEKTKIIFLKKRFDNKKNKEIAEDLNISLKSVESHMTKALNSLKIKLSEYLPAILIAFILKN